GVRPGNDLDVRAEGRPSLDRGFGLEHAQLVALQVFRLHDWRAREQPAITRLQPVVATLAEKDDAALLERTDHVGKEITCQKFLEVFAIAEHEWRIHNAEAR